jgi:hypothetical protein
MGAAVGLGVFEARGGRSKSKGGAEITARTVQFDGAKTEIVRCSSEQPAAEAVPIEKEA